MKEYQKPLKRKGLALFPKGKGKTARIRKEASEGSFGRKRTVFREFSLERNLHFSVLIDSTKTSNGKNHSLQRCTKGT